MYQGKKITPGSQFEYRDAPPSSTDFDTLSSRAKEVHTVLEEPEDSKERRLYTLTDFHGVFPFSIERIIPVFTEYEDEHETYGHMFYTKDLSPEEGPMEPHFQEVKTGFKFLGIGAEQHYILYKVPERLSEDEFLIKWNLAESVDGKFYLFYGSWYLKQLPPDTEDSSARTYIRNYAVIGHNDPPRGMKLAYKLFLNSQIRGIFQDVYDEAKKQESP
ncbi:MAG: hypothetical protein R6V67_06680 [Spirochaetia bacterium]